jgi:hypothetical protein
MAKAKAEGISEIEETMTGQYLWEQGDVSMRG